MKPFPEEDPRLTEFLKHHRPEPPAASAALEDRLMSLVMDAPAAIAPTPSTRHRPWRRAAWLFPSAIAAGLVAIVSYQSFLPPQPSEAELAELESFIESTWQGTLAEQPPTETEELYPLMDESRTN
ncbi:MAG: hypothetical protein NW224_28705 [Leptolyngbyaceae cyanobacterium bins.302]|nr:hypothetical protein [Leptolyngbyaceae cyanobacterium bins.302]